MTHHLSQVSLPHIQSRPFSNITPKKVTMHEHPPSNQPPKHPTAPLPTNTLPHLTPSQEIHLISTTDKPLSHRRALAIGHVVFSTPTPLHLIRASSLKKGDVLAVARIAGIQALKRTSEIIPLAHGGVGVEGGWVRVEVVGGTEEETGDGGKAGGRERKRKGEEKVETESVGNLTEEERKTEAAMGLTVPLPLYGGVRIAVLVETTAKTGVEMEALTGVMGAALTAVDMVKGVDRGVVVGGIRIVGKEGGRRGGWGIWETDIERRGRVGGDGQAEGKVGD